MNKVAITQCNTYDLCDVDDALSELMNSLGYSFSDFIKPGMTVFIKPNWVASRWRESCPHVDTLYSVITHPSIIEAVADRVVECLQGNGRIIIGDNPSIDADFEELMEFTGIRKLESKYNVPCEFLDLRPLVCKDLEDYGKKNKMHRQIGDPRGNIEINLGSESLLYGVDSTLFRGVFDEREETVASHTGENQLYTFSKSIYDADVYISLPKLKTHHKVGATINLKGLVGTVTDKNQLVHWRIGTPETGGDEYPDVDSFEASRKEKVTKRGAHPGNDTIWRMVVDLYYAMKKRNRVYFSLVDGVIAGEGEGPLNPHSKKANVLIAGNDFLSVDVVSTRLMGFNPEKISYLEHFFSTCETDYDTITVIENGVMLENFFSYNSRYLDFIVPEKWSDIKVKLR